MKNLVEYINEDITNKKNIFLVRRESNIYLVFAKNKKDAELTVEDAVVSGIGLTIETRDIIHLDDKTLKFYEKTRDVIKL